MADPELQRVVETVGAAHLEAMYAAAGDATREALGLRQARLTGGFVGVMAHDPTDGFWSRALGVEPLTGESLDEVIGFARDGGARSLVVPVADEAADELLGSRGLTPGDATAKFLVPGGFTAYAETGLHVEQIGPDIGKHFAHVMCEAYGMDEDSALPAWIVEAMSAPGVTSYAAFDGWKIVAVAWLFVRDGVARLRGAATLPEERGRGAHAALVARRIHDADALGVRWITTEADATDNAALRNLRRLGLAELYRSRDWTWRP
jgi:hypothetical protein